MTLDFGDWYRDNAARLVATVGTAVANDDVARDAVAEACTKAYSRWAKVGGYDNPTGWVYVVALREAQRRKGRRQREVELTDAAGVETPPGYDPAVWQAVRSLPDRMRLAIALRYVADMSENDIATVMAISRGGVAALLTKARAALRERLSGETPPSMEVSHNAVD